MFGKLAAAALFVLLLSGCQGAPGPGQSDGELNERDGRNGQGLTAEEQEIVDFFAWHGDGSWDATATTYRGNDGKFIEYRCPADGRVRENQVWGTDVYSDDSSVCTAAVHFGLIGTDNGGTLAVKILPGQESYAGSTRNGYTSLDYGEWTGSFTFQGPAKGVQAAGETFACAEIEAEATLHQLEVTCDLEGYETATIQVEVPAGEDATVNWEAATGDRVVARQHNTEGQLMWSGTAASYGSAYLPNQAVATTYVLTWENVKDEAISVTIAFYGTFRVTG